jgi:hypothetical protein
MGFITYQNVTNWGLTGIPAHQRANSNNSMEKVVVEVEVEVELGAVTRRIIRTFS